MDLTTQHIEQNIPKKSERIDTFVDSTISLMTDNAIQQCETLAMHSHDVKTPFFLVSKGEHNYIYSFNRIVESLDAEIKSRRDFFDKKLTISIIPMLIVILGLILSHLTQSIEPTNELRLLTGLLFGAGAYATAQTIYRHPFKAIKKLKAIRAMVFDQSKAYLSELAEDAKRPVIII